MFKITSQNDHEKKNCLYIQIRPSELALSISEHYLHHTTTFYNSIKIQRKSASDASAGSNYEASAGLNNYIQTQHNSDSDDSTGANDVSSSGLYQITNHHCSMYINNNDDLQSYETPKKKITIATSLVIQYPPQPHRDRQH